MEELLCLQKERNPCRLLSSSSDGAQWMGGDGWVSYHCGQLYRWRGGGDFKAYGGVVWEIRNINRRCYVKALQTEVLASLAFEPRRLLTTSMVHLFSVNWRQEQVFVDFVGWTREACFLFEGFNFGAYFSLFCWFFFFYVLFHVWYWVKFF